MEFDEYQARAAKTATYTFEDSTSILMYLCLGLAGETGEVIEKVKHLIRDAGGAVTPERREHLKKEIGDVLWYASQLARALELSFDEIAQHNIEKLADRAQRGVIKSEGDTR
jgi:NTP pyrophosphatase (non-canonical NTP hydrolase)